MINFFRKIRKQLADDNKPLKYMRYAIGEIVLVVIGILIALQINNLNEQRSINRTESEYLANLKDEFTENLQHLETIFKNRKKTSGDIARLMELFGTEPKEVSDEELSKLLRSINDYYSIVFMATTPVFEEIKNSGNLITISNADLRKHLILWEQIKDPLLGTQKEIFRYRNDFLEKMAEVGSLKDMGGGVIDFPTTKGLNFTNNNKLLLQDRNAGNLLWSIQGELYLFEKVTYPSVKSHIERIIELIDENLD
jgi:hypothetical protein